MKKILISSLFVIGLINTSVGQNNSYGVSIGTGKGMIMKQALEGGASYDLNRGISLGFQYSRKLTNRLHLMTGINWYKNSVSVTPSFYPGIDMTPKVHDIQLMYIPIYLKIDLWKYFFVNGGLIADVDITKEKYLTSQSGIGAGLGIGGEIPITTKFAIQLNPYFNFHGLMLTNSETYPERVFDSGIKLNLILKR